MDDLAYWTENMREAEQELEAARGYPMSTRRRASFSAKARLRELEQSAKPAKPRSKGR